MCSACKTCTPAVFLDRSHGTMVSAIPAKTYAEGLGAREQSLHFDLGVAWPIQPCCNLYSFAMAIPRSVFRV